MNGAIDQTMRSFEHAFGDGGVRMNDVSEVGCGGLEAKNGATLCDEVGGMVSDDVNTENLTILAVGNEFEEAFASADDSPFTPGCFHSARVRCNLLDNR